MSAAHGHEDIELRDVDSQIPAEEARPDIPGEHDSLSLDAAMFRHDAGYPSTCQIETSDGAMLDDSGAAPTGTLCHGCGQQLRLHAAIGAGPNRARPWPRGMREQACHGFGGENLDVAVARASRLVSPGFKVA